MNEHGEVAQFLGDLVEEDRGGGHEADGRPSTYVRALHHLEVGRIDAAPLISHRYGALDDVAHAFTNDFGTADYIKGVVVT